MPKAVQLAHDVAAYMATFLLRVFLFHSLLSVLGYGGQLTTDFKLLTKKRRRGRWNASSRDFSGRVKESVNHGNYFCEKGAQPLFDEEVKSDRRVLVRVLWTF